MIVAQFLRPYPRENLRWRCGRRNAEPATPARRRSLAEKVCLVFWRMPETLFEGAGPR
jgi:hypothetical protein